MIFPEAGPAVNAKCAVWLRLGRFGDSFDAGLAEPKRWRYRCIERPSIITPSYSRPETMPQSQLTCSIMRNRVLRAGIAIELDCAQSVVRMGPGQRSSFPDAQLRI